MIRQPKKSSPAEAESDRATKAASTTDEVYLLHDESTDEMWWLVNGQLRKAEPGGLPDSRHLKGLTQILRPSDVDITALLEERH